MAEKIIDQWPSRQRILVILAHPDDPEFFCGATLAFWAKNGHDIQYCLLTKGEKGSNDISEHPENLKSIRVLEQRDAAAIIGVTNIEFLDNEDGFLESNNSTRREIVKVIRRQKPDIVLTSDPTNLFHRDNYINHPDHLAAGRIVHEAIFPASGNPFYYPELIAEGLEPHMPKEIWFSLPSQPNVVFDITDYWRIKLSALCKHRSQIGNIDKFNERMLNRRTQDSTDDDPRFEEKFYRIVFPSP
jgi:LmbE family N-acetylglucosaminyl deacetylase